MERSLKNRSLISILDFSKEEINFILDKASFLKQHPHSNLLQGKILASCFFEPSTRTRLSFETAMLRLGGNVIGFSDAGSTSLSKGESLHDSIKVIGDYADLVVIRHPLEGSAKLASEATNKPVINAGDGANQHPSQTLSDLFTIKECQKRLDNLKIALVGDLKYGRTVHSLAIACAHYNIQLYFVCPLSLSLPDQICNTLRQMGVKYSFHQSIEEIIDKVDILYMTRLQKERFELHENFLSVQERFILHPEMLKNCKRNLKIMHPLPRNEEIPKEIDSTPFAYYFEQAHNALHLRKALLLVTLLDQETLLNEENSVRFSHS